MSVGELGRAWGGRAAYHGSELGEVSPLLWRLWKASSTILLTFWADSLQDPNPNLPTGMVELVAEKVDLLNSVTGSLPLVVSEDPEAEEPKEDTRLKHRVLDLRCEPLPSSPSEGPFACPL